MTDFRMARGTRETIRKRGRAAVRNAIYSFGIVESLHNGLVTVRLGSISGPRLTNLRLIGEDVEEGQRVKVDYSAGTPPTVLSTLQAETTEIEIPESTGAAKISTKRDLDTSCHVFQDWWPLETQFDEGPRNWFVFKFGGNGWAIPAYTGWDVWPYPDPIHWEYDNADFVDKIEYYTEFLTVPSTGRYLVTAQMNPYDTVRLSEAFEFRLKKNGTIFAEKSFCPAFNRVGSNKNMYALHVLEPFDAGDIIAMEYYWTYDNSRESMEDATWNNSGNWSDRQFITLNLWPGTE
jgi:hypothetical protein